MTVDANKLQEAVNSLGRGSWDTEFDGSEGVIATPGFDTPVDSYEQLLEHAGFDPEAFELSGPPLIKTWDGQTAEGVRRLYSYRLPIRKKAEKVNVEDLIEAIHASEATATEPRATANVTVIAIGDIQLGKADGDGTQGIIARYKKSVAEAVRRYNETPTETVVLAYLGDCVEGVVSQKGRVIGDSDLTLTEQLRTLRHLMTQTILAFEHAPRLVVSSVPGNHDEAFREPVNPKPNDSFAIDSLRAVEEAFLLANRNKHMRFVYPAESELVAEVVVGDHSFLLAHGHQWNTGRHFDWWKGQAFSYQTGHSADYLLAGHRHHFEVDTDSHRFFIQVPALESESVWFRNKTGKIGNPGIVYLVPGELQPAELAVV